MTIPRLLLSVLGLLLTSQGCHGGETLNMLNGIHQYMEGSGSIDPVFYQTLVECFNLFDPLLLASQDAQWAGMVHYAENGGDPAAGDIWHGCADENRWFENNCSVQEYGNMPIHEPCNYASNIAYYHTVIEICKYQDWSIPTEYVASLLRSYAFLTQGSAFLHGSQTHLGGTTDTRTNDLIILAAHQASIASLEPLNSSILHDLSYTPREKSTIQITEEWRDAFVDLPSEQWVEYMEGLDMGDVVLNVCGILSTAGNLALNETEFDTIMNWFFENSPFISEEIKDFCQNVYVPAFREATEHIELSEIEQFRLRNHVYGVLIKLLYAVIWQEEDILGEFDIYSPEINALGWEYLPIVNDFVNLLLLNYDYYNPDFQHGVDIYPGEDGCNPKIPHAKWHLQVGIGLTDLIFLADEVNGIIERFNP